jgi:integrase
VRAGTWAKYQSHLRQHILSRFADTALADINRIAVKAWVKALRRKLAEPTVADVASLLSTILGDAVEEGMIGASPCRKLRTHSGDQSERPHASPVQVLRIAERCTPTHRVLIIVAGYTGLRWGELAGLQWAQVDLIAGTIAVDPEVGALHEVGGKLVLGPPKTPASARTVHLPTFLLGMLAEHRADHDHRFVFTGSDGGLLRRSNFRRRVWLPAVAGDRPRGWAPIHPALHFHDLRHTHMTWLIEDGVPEVAQAKRLGHRLAGVRGIYSHVTPPMIDALRSGLQHRWEHSCSQTTDVTSVRGQDQLLPICSHRTRTAHR